MAQAGCAVCADIKKKQVPGMVVLVSEQDLEPGAPASKKKLKPEKKKDFLTKLNAVVNDGGGLVCLHGVDPHMLGSFDQSVNMAMASLIPDDSSYPDNFERHLNKDNHVVFRVKQRERPLSTLCFNTKISHDKGVEDPTHGQMKCFLNPMKSEDDEGASAGRGTSISYKFTHQEEAIVETRRAGRVKEVVFQEGIDVQAKKIPTENAPVETITNLTKLFFDAKKPGTFLPKYFAAFSKLRNGGSVFLGVEEEKIVQGVPEIDTGIFKCQGVSLTEDEQGRFQEVVMDKAKTMMYWHPGLFTARDAQPETVGSESSSFQPPIEVRFHRVEQGSTVTSNLVVPEIVVKKYPGMAFTSSDGPEYYKIQRSNQNTSFAAVRMDKIEWFENYKELWCENCFLPKHVESCSCPQ